MTKNGIHKEKNKWQQLLHTFSIVENSFHLQKKKTEICTNEHENACTIMWITSVLKCWNQVWQMTSVRFS